MLDSYWVKFTTHNENGRLYPSARFKKPPLFTGDLPVNLAIETVHEIAKTYPKPFNLLVSGGVDSQAMLWAWKKSGVPFNAITFDYVDDSGASFNEHDRKALELFSSTHGINYEIKSFNIFSFLEKNLYEYASQYNCASPQLTAYMKMIESIGEGTVILSGNFLINYFPNYTEWGLLRFAEKSPISVIPFFFMHTAELAFAATEVNREIKSTLKVFYYRDMSDHFAYLIKCYTYMYSGFPVMMQMQKFSGFEKVKDYFDTKPELVPAKDKIKYIKRASRRIYDLKFRYPLEDFLNYENKVKIVEKKLIVPI